MEPDDPLAFRGLLEKAQEDSLKLGRVLKENQFYRQIGSIRLGVWVIVALLVLIILKLQ